MANQLSRDAKRVSGIIDEIEGYNRTISLLEYQICDVPQERLEEDKDDLRDEMKRLQNTVNTLVNDLKFDDNINIKYDGKLIQVERNGVLWLEYHEGYDLSVKQEWKEYQPSNPSDIRNRRVAFLQGFAWDRMSDELLEETMTFMKAHGFDAVK